MALTFTPGGAADDTLASLAFVKSYLDDRGRDYDTLTGSDDTILEQKIRIATTVVEGMGGPTGNLPKLWPGRKATATQRREWPRSGAAYVDGTAIDDDVVPAAVQEAVAEAAFYELENPGELQEALSDRMVTQETIGKITVRYADNGMSGINARTKLTSIYDLLASLLIPDLSNGPKLYLRSVGKVI